MYVDGDGTSFENYDQAGTLVSGFYFRDNSLTVLYGSNTFTLNGNGYISFPDGTTQNTAFTPIYQTSEGLASNVAVLAANSASYLNGNTALDLRSFSTSESITAYTNATNYAATMAGVAYANSVFYANSIVGTAYTNAISYANNAAIVAYSNAVSYANDVATTSYSNAVSFSSNATNLTTGTVAEARLPYRMNQSVRTTDNVTFGNVTVSGVIANGTAGANNQRLVSNGTTVYWKTPAQRADISGSTLPVANNTTYNLDLTGFKSYILQKLNTSAAARVRLYVDAASRTSDASRDLYVEPTSGLGLIAEFVTSGNQTIKASPAIIGYNNNSPADKTVYLAVTNYSGATASIQVTLTLLELEE